MENNNLKLDNYDSRTQALDKFLFRILFDLSSVSINAIWGILTASSFIALINKFALNDNLTNQGLSSFTNILLSIFMIVGVFIINSIMLKLPQNDYKREYKLIAVTVYSLSTVSYIIFRCIYASII